MLSKERINYLLTTTPIGNGCYLFKNERKEVVYVGKAKNIKKRIAQHFNSRNSKSLLLLKEIVDWETFLTNNEKEALILEHNLIKKYYPRYNILLTDDKIYPYIFINKKSSDPSYSLIWRKRKFPGIYYGPFSNQYDSREILQLLETLFPLWKCKKKTSQPCFYYHLNQCSGACFKKVKKKYYQLEIKKIQNFFQGKVEEIKTNYQAKINQAVAKMQFEQAKKWQTSLKQIDYFKEKQNVEFSNYLNCDVVNFALEKAKILIVIFFYRQGKLQLKKENYFSLFNNNIEETLENFLEEIYTYHPLPQEIVLSEKINLPFFQARYKVKIVHPKKGRKLKILQLVALNAQNLMKNQAVEDKQKRKISVLKKLEKIVGVTPINRIEFLDLSYWDNKLIIAGFSHYLNGDVVFKKNKIYKITTKEYNEKKLFTQAIVQHYQNFPLPDLIILDGNILQLQGAQLGLKKLAKKANIVCLTKNKKHKTDYLFTQARKKIKLLLYPQLLLFLEKIQTNGHLYVIRNLHKYSPITH